MNPQLWSALLGLRSTSIRGSGGTAFVPMMQPANLRHRYHTPRVRRLHRPTLRSVLLQRQMNARTVIVIILEE
jgi:hypothetical protein